MKIGIENNFHASKTLQENNQNMIVINKDIKNTDPIHILKNAKIKRRDIAVIAGGPPCQGFSHSNKRSRNIKNPLNDLYLEFFRYVKELMPKSFLIENVPGMKSLSNGIVLKNIINYGEKLSYNMQYKILNSHEYGVPQKRKRIFIIGTKKEIDDVFQNKIKKTISVKEAISDLPDLENGNNIDELEYSKFKNLSFYQKKMRDNGKRFASNNLVSKNCDLVIDRYKHIPQGGNWSNVPKRLMKNYANLSNCHSWIYYRLKWNGPSVVINNFRKNMLIHPSKHRGLSVREAARLQSFPDHYKFYGKKDLISELKKELLS